MLLKLIAGSFDSSSLKNQFLSEIFDFNSVVFVFDQSCKKKFLPFLLMENSRVADSFF